LGLITSILIKVKKDDHELTYNTLYDVNLLPHEQEPIKYDLDKRKKLTSILFVDDDTKFRVVSILKTAGWINTKAIKDIGNLDDQLVKEARIIFVDIQGVGKLLQTKDEGLGLALNLKKKYPDKKIVIYSAQTEGDRFHEALRKADASLAKNAEPYEFQQLVEQYSEEFFK
jgi:DNA-binding NtrC family response regulator